MGLSGLLCHGMLLFLSVIQSNTTVHIAIYGWLLKQYLAIVPIGSV